MQPEVLLRAHGLRATAVRCRVLDVLNVRASACSMSELSDALNGDRVTLYRTLKTFEESGIIHRVQDGTTQDKYALCGSDCSSSSHQHDHAHFHCKSCGDTVCLDVPAPPSPVLPKGYRVATVHFTLSGECANCQPVGK